MLIIKSNNEEKHTTRTKARNIDLVQRTSDMRIACARTRERVEIERVAVADAHRRRPPPAGRDGTGRRLVPASILDIGTRSPTTRFYKYV